MSGGVGGGGRPHLSSSEGMKQLIITHFCGDVCYGCTYPSSCAAARGQINFSRLKKMRLGRNACLRKKNCYFGQEAYSSQAELTPI